MTSNVMARPWEGRAPVAQAPGHVVMIRPHRFSVNPATAGDNAFQRSDSLQDGASRAYEETTGLAEALRAEGITVSLFEDENGSSPDSVFCNNWFTTHPDGRILLCPMFAPNRRRERRQDVIEHLRRSYVVSDVLDWTDAEASGQFLEGTGSVVIDHVHQVAYGCRSNRLTPELFLRFCDEFELQPVLFDAVDGAGWPIFHTNIMMSVGESIALIGSSLIPDPAQRALVLDTLQASGRTIVELDEGQVAHFAGNALQLHASAGPVLAMSTTARASLRPDQVDMIEAHCRIVAVDVSTVEASGGSVRCMLAGVHLPGR